jgi:hypothetical protein
VVRLEAKSLVDRLLVAAISRPISLLRLRREFRVLRRDLLRRDLSLFLGIILRRLLVELVRRDRLRFLHLLRRRRLLLFLTLRANILSLWLRLPL